MCNYNFGFFDRLVERIVTRSGDTIASEFHGHPPDFLYNSVMSAIRVAPDGDE